MGEAGAGKSTVSHLTRHLHNFWILYLFAQLINLIAGEPIANIPKSADIQEYTCTYKDKNTHHTWKLHLLDTPGFAYETRANAKSLYAIQKRLRNISNPSLCSHNDLKSDCSSNSISGVIYCHDINQGRLAGLQVASRLKIIFEKPPGESKDRMMKNVILCTTHWDILVDKSVGKHRIQELEKDNWNELLELGAHLTRHDNTHKSVEKLLGLITRKEAIMLLKELGLAEMTPAGKAAFMQNYEMRKRLWQEMRSTHIKEAADKAEIKGDDENSADFVPLQFKPFTGKYALTPELAATKFQNVDIDLLLDALNEIFDTKVPISYPGIQKTLEYLINKGHDLGAIYAHMQVIWPTSSVPSMSSKPFTGNNSHFVIGAPELASRKCQDIDELLNLLNMSFDTKIPRSMPGVNKVLRFLVDQGYKFGDICAHMRHTWPRTPELEKEWSKVWKLERMNLKVWEDFLTLEKRGEEYEVQRQKSLRQDTIHTLNLIKPRRIWDLYAHRVIPYQFSVVDANSNNYNLLLRRSAIPARLYLHFGSTRLGRYHPVSHSWTEDMSPVDSPVNAYEWPVPLPHGVTLEAVRNELLNLGAQYAWLDVVCLRQKSSDSTREAIRIKEWKIDVPIIGKLYKASPSVDNVIRYLNGLGKAFRRNGWQDKRHWSQRAWTLQEVNGKYIEAGIPDGVKDLLEETDDNGTLLRDHLKTREIRLPFQPGKGFGQTDLHNAIAAMKGRHSQNPVDKIFGLSALLECRVQLAYSENEQEEDAWGRLLRHVSSRIWAELLFGCPLPGKNGCYWRPSWSQLMADTGVIEKVPSLHLASSELAGDHHRLLCHVPLIEGCQVLFNYPPASTVVIKTERQGKKYEWTMINLNPHTQDIVPGILYTLAGVNFRPSLHWVLCRPCPYRGLEKVSVLRRSPDEIQGSNVIGIGLDRLERPGSDPLMCFQYVVFR